VIDLPPPSYEQTIEAIVRCEIPRGNVRVAYASYLQSDEVTVTHLGTVTDEKLRCLKGAVHPFYILTIADMDQRAAFYEYSEREERPKEKSDALDWLRAKGLLARLPIFDSGKSLEDFAVAVELACDMEAESALMVFDKSWITVRPDALSIETFEKWPLDLECLTKMMAASDAHENGVRFGFVGNAAIPEEKQK
jgi:hypothetical protein